MKNSRAEGNAGRFAVVLFVLCAFFVIARSAATRAETTSIKVVNNSSREIVHVYLSPVDKDDWGANQLGKSTVPSGQSFVISDATCNQPQIKVIAENEDSCFLAVVVACGDVTWTISDDTQKNCGD